MINKFYKRIHNKFSNFFNFFFFLRYVISIFIITLCLFLLIPKFFDYEKKQVILSKSLDNFYNLELSEFDSIKYTLFPLPNLSINSANFKIKGEPISFYSKNIQIFLNFKNIYNFENLKPKKVLAKDSNASLNIDNTKDIIVFFKELNHKIDIRNLNIILKKNDNSILEIKNINFSNYGYKKDKISGIAFDKKFKMELDKKNKNLSFKILDTGVKAHFNFDKIRDNLVSGTTKIIVLNNYLKSNFVLQNKELEIKKANFRNKDTSLSFNSLVILHPFFEINSNIEVNKLDLKLFNDNNLRKIIKNQEILKKFNSKFEINFKKKKTNKLIQGFFSTIKLEHGRITFSKKTNLPKGEINCRGYSLLVEEYPRLNFKCIIDIEDNEKILKKFSISKKIKLDLKNLNIIGSINLLNKKINFENIFIDEIYNAKKEDLNYFKKTFEEILLNESFLDMFNTDKIKEFLVEII